MDGEMHHTESRHILVIVFTLLELMIQAIIAVSDGNDGDLLKGGNLHLYHYQAKPH